MPRPFKQLMHAWSETVGDVRTGWRPLVTFALLSTLLSFAVVTPILSGFLAAVLRWSGDTVVSNSDLLSFGFSLQGLLFIAVLASVSFAVLFLELGGLALIALGIRQGERMSAVRTLLFLGRRFRRLCWLGLRQSVILGALLAVVLAVAAATKVTVLGGGDIYFYLRVKPAELWWALTIIATATTIALIVIVVLLVRWLFAVPVLLLTDETARRATEESRRLVRATGYWWILLRLAGWAAAMLLLTTLVGAAHGLVERVLVGIAGERVEWLFAMAGLVLAIDVLLGIVIALAASTTFAMVVARLYARACPDTRVPSSLRAQSSSAGRRGRLQLRLSVAGAGAALLVLAAVLTHALIDGIRLDDTVMVTAHRGSSSVAPENTMASLLQAIDDGADFAEIDVQETRDGVVVLFHDTDLRRIAGVDRRIWEVTYDELSRLDVGSWFSDEFADERVPTLEQAIRTTKGRIKLNIELKFNGHDRQLEAEVVRLIRQAAFRDECIVTSLDYGGIREIARQDDGLRTGLIVAANVGDVTNYDVDVLAVNARLVSRTLVRRAHRAGKEIHVWGVSDVEQMLTMIHLGVDNILTGTPDVLVELMRRRSEMSNAEKIVLYVSDFLAGRL